MRKPIIIIIVLLVLLIGGIFYISMQKDTPVIRVDVTLAAPPDNNSEHIISNVNASIVYVKKMEVREETQLVSPGITVVLLQDMLVQSGWYSVGINASGVYGNYTLIVKPYAGLNTSRPFAVLTRVLDPVGKDVSVRRTEHRLQ